MMTGQELSAKPAMDAIGVPQELLRWRDACAIEAALRLVRFTKEASVRVRAEIAKLTTPELIAARTGFLDFPPLKAILEEATALANVIAQEAHAELDRIIPHEMAIALRSADGDTDRSFGGDEAIAIGRGIVPIALAGGVLAVLPTAATTTTVAMFGLVSTSVVSLPVLAAGALGVGALAYFGGSQVGDIRASLERAMATGIDRALDAGLLASEGSEAPSLLTQLQRTFARAVDELLERQA